VKDEVMLDVSNCGKVYIDTGEITKEELVKELATSFNPTWPWQVRQLDEWSFLVRFPPNKRVQDLADLYSINLHKEGVSIKVEVWNGELDSYTELQDVWLQIRGIPPKWCSWQVLDQLASSYGLLEDMDWQGLFQSFYEVARIKIKCRDYTKIPKQRIFCMGNKLYNLDMTVETSEVQNTENGDNDGEDGDDGKDDPAMEDEDPLDPEEPNFGAGGSTARNGTPQNQGASSSKLK